MKVSHIKNPKTKFLRYNSFNHFFKREEVKDFDCMGSAKFFIFKISKFRILLIELNLLNTSEVFYKSNISIFSL